MMAFEPMFRLEVQHDYYAPALPPLVIEPDAETRRFAALPDVRLRYGRASVEAFCNVDREALKASDDDARLHLTFRLRTTDLNLMGVTDLFTATQGQAVVIDQTCPSDGALHDGETVSTSNLRQLSDPDAPFSPQDQQNPPFALINLTIDPSIVNRSWHIRFGAAQRYWTYNVIGGSDDARFSVNDTQDQLAFEQLDPGERPDGRTFQRFRSTEPISARSRPGARFELVNDGPFGRRIVIPVLPAASAHMGAIDPSGDPPGMNNDIYVYL